MLREVGANHYVACHFPLAEGEQLDFAKVGVGAHIGIDEPTPTSSTDRRACVAHLEIRG